MLIALTVGSVLILAGMVSFVRADRLAEARPALDRRGHTADLDRATWDVVAVRIVAGLVVAAGVAVIVASTFV